jgi:hypothetical protein
MNIPSKASTYTAYNARAEMIRVDALVDVVTELTMRLSAAETKLVACEDSCKSCPSKDAPKKASTSK